MNQSALLVLGAMALTGCQSYDKQFAEARQHYIVGNHDMALQITAPKVAKPGGTDELVWQLEHAAILRAAERFGESEEAFDVAHEMFMNNLDEAAKIRLSTGVDLLTSPANSRYWGTGYDGIMIQVYQTLNALQLGDMGAAQVNITRSYLLQQEIVANNAARIEKEKEAIAKDKTASAGASDERNKSKIAGAQADAIADMGDVSAEMKAYSDYVNPFAVYLDGLFYYAKNDMERARHRLQRVHAFAPNNGTVDMDYKAVSSGQPMQSSVYVIFETGIAAHLEEVKFEIFIPSVAALGAVVSAAKNLPTDVSIAYPKLVTTPNTISHLVVTTSAGGNGQGVKTARVMSMDAVIAREFKNNFASTMTKAVASAVVKTIAQIAANAVADAAIDKAGSALGPFGGVAKMGTRLATGAASGATTFADTRSWQTLPKEFQVARCDMPKNRVVTLSTPDKAWSQNVTLEGGDVVVVYVKSVGSTITVNQFNLR